MTSSIRKGLLQFIFSGAYMKRWNDKLRPMELIEIDKQAHKMIIAWLLCQISGQTMSPDHKLHLEVEVVEGGIFDYLFRLVITDIKPPIFYRIKENPDHYQELAKWVIGEIEPHLRPVGNEFWERFCRYVLRMERHGLAADILGAAHAYSSAWEFRLIRPLNDAFDEELPDVDKRFLQELAGYEHLPGMADLVTGLKYAFNKPCQNASFEETTAGSELVKGEQNISALARFGNLCGQLRFQKRWSQTPRVPETSVMGHMFLVACYSYFLSLVLKACPSRRVNNFFCGLFHDMPELLTRDIISPVKKSFEELEKLIHQYERMELQRRVFDPLEREGLTCVTSRLAYYLGHETGSEFHSTIRENGIVRRVDFDALHGRYNEDLFDPKDGESIKICDILAAYIEAYTAMRNGITSDHIQQAFWRMREQNMKTILGGIHIGSLFTDFD